MQSRSDILCVADVHAVLGEGPVWVAQEAALYWVDIKGRKIFRLDGRGKLEQWETPFRVGSLAPCSGGGFVAGTGDLPYAQTMAFTTLMLFQIFNLVNARSDEQSAFAHLFTNRWLWMAIALSVGLQFIVVYVPFLQRAFGTVALSGHDWLVSVAVASSVLWLREASKLIARARMKR